MIVNTEYSKELHKIYMEGFYAFYCWDVMPQTCPYEDANFAKVWNEGYERGKSLFEATK